jgi:hypothetical protein
MATWIDGRQIKQHCTELFDGQLEPSVVLQYTPGPDMGFSSSSSPSPPASDPAILALWGYMDRQYPISQELTRVVAGVL